MKNFERIILIAVVVVPIAISIILIKNVWSEEETPIVEVSDPYYTSGDDISSSSGEIVNSGELVESGESGEVRTIVGQEFVSKLGSPISKIYLDATVSNALSNVYSESDENAEVLGKLEKNTKVTAQKYEQGWSIVTGIDSKGINVSGWVKTANITYPEDAPLISDSTKQTGTVTTKDTPLNVREKAASGSNILTTVAKGATVVIEDTYTDSSTNKKWYKITSNGITGWVSADYVKLK